MEFIEGSRGIYRPIRVLFDTPIYDRALQLCWNINSYNSQIALLRELLMLQEARQIPSQVTSEDMIRFLMEESKSTLRERLWEFELEDFDEDDARPLLKLVWEVNNNNKMRDIEFEAQMLLNSSEPISPKFLHPKVLSMAMNYAKILRTKQEAPSSKLLSPQEVVLEVVPRVLQGFWTLPHRSYLNMPSQKLGKMSVGVTKAVLDRVTEALTSIKGQTTFPRSIRDDVVLSILTQIRQTHPHDVLVNNIKSFAPVLLSEIVDVAAEQICWMFQPPNPEVPAVKPPATAPVQEDLTLTTTPSPETNPAVVSPLTTSQTPPVEPPSTADVETREDKSDDQSLENNPELIGDPDSAVVPVSPAPPVEPPSITDVETREDDRDKSGLENDSEPTRDPDSAVVPPTSTPPVEPPSITDVETRKDECDEQSLENNPELIGDPDSAAVLSAPAPPDEPPSKTDVETREDESDKSGHGNDSEPTRDPDSAVVPPTTTPPTEPPSVTDVEARKHESDKSCFGNNREATREPDLAAVLTSLIAPAEPASVPDVQVMEEENEKSSLDEHQKSIRDPHSAATPAPPAEPAIITAVQKRVQGFSSWLLQPMCCPFRVRDALSELLSLTVNFLCKLIK